MSIIDDIIIIRHDGKIYKANLNDLTIIDASRSYIDIYDYIAKDIEGISIEKNKSIFDASNEIFIKITENEFKDWQRNNSKRFIQNDDRLTGKEIWINKLSEEIIEN